MAKKEENNIEKSYEFVIYEGDKKFKRMYQAEMCIRDRYQTMLMTQTWKLPVWRTNGYVMDNL